MKGFLQRVIGHMDSIYGGVVARPSDFYVFTPCSISRCSNRSVHFVCRQLAYDGAEFDLAMVDLDHVFQVQYARSAAMWQLLALLVPKAGCWALTHGRVFSLLWADHQRFFKSMLMAAKVPALADEALKAINSNHCVVIGLQSTGEANMQAEKEKGGIPHSRASAQERAGTEHCTGSEIYMFLWASGHCLDCGFC